MDEFLHELFGAGLASGCQVSLFTVPEKRARRFTDIPTALQVAQTLATTQNVYFNVGMIAGSPKGRGKAEDVGALVALWADVDFQSPAHANHNLPADAADFERLIPELPLPPSVVVDSGNGRHLYWLFRDPWVFADTGDRSRGTVFAKGWHEMVCRAASRLGWSLENLGDITRVLRLPGTVNRKDPEHTKPVTIVTADWQRRYSLDDFEPFLPITETSPDDAPSSTEASAKIRELLLLPDAEPPGDKLVAAILDCPLFREAWDRTREDLADQSASAYDLSLATIAMMRGWSDQEVARLIIAWRRRHGESPEKALRRNYMSRTLQKARKATVTEDPTVDLSGFMVRPQAQPEASAAPPDPGPMPESLCRIPGFVAEVMDLCLETAPYPNVALAFCGALALQAVLAGRKVRDEADNRTNIYLLALAFSAGGKDWPRKLNTKILHEVGMLGSLGDKFASGEGIQDALFLSPALLFQTDEIDGIVQSINKSRDARYENILGTLLTMYSSANSMYPMRRKAGKEPPGVIDQPCLVVYGTAVPTHYYNALSERMLTNGFFARMLIVEAGCRSNGQDAKIIKPSSRILDTSRWWSEFAPGNGNLQSWHPVPQVVDATPDARDLLRQSRIAAEVEYREAERRNDAVGTTVWGRVHEQVRKLSLIHAISANHITPQVDATAVEWASTFVTHQTRRMLFMAHGHVAENPFHSECLKLVRKLQESPEQQLEHSVLLKRMKVDARTFAELTTTLEQQGDICSIIRPTTGRPQRMYRLLRSVEPVNEEG
ncbi:MAG: hypothetical protein ACKO3T_18300 [Planctomycetaceae bacterium]